MRTWMKYLVTGWSIVSVGIIIITFQIVKHDVIQEYYDIRIVPKQQPAKPESAKKERKGRWVIINKDEEEKYKLFGDIFDQLNPDKEDFVKRLINADAKGLTVTSQNYVNNHSVYIWFPVYAFFVWALPITIFSLLGVLFSKKNTVK